jgi:hypothetical protein
MEGTESIRAGKKEERKKRRKKIRKENQGKRRTNQSLDRM